MKKRIYNQASLFGPLYAYLVVLSPPAEIKAEIAEIKADLNAISDIGERNVQSIAHITLIDKLTDDADFAETITTLLNGQTSFIIRLKGRNVFDHGHSSTLYIDVENPEPIVRLMKLLKPSSKTPHLSLAKKIPPKTLEALQPYLEDFDYSAEWVCSEVTVLRKLMSEKHLGFKDSFKVGLAG